VSPHTWHYAGSGALFQDSGLTTPAVSDDDPIGGSTNQGSDSHSIVQATAGNKPTLKLNILNGEPVYRCNGGDFLQGAFNGALSQPFTILTVADFNEPMPSSGNNYLFSSDDNINRMDLRVSSTKWSIFAGADLSGGAENSNNNIWLGLFNGASSQLWLNGVSVVSGNVGAHNGDGLTFGAYSTGAFGWVGDIYEVLIYDSNLSNADKNEVGNYLATKYTLSWTAIT